MTILRSLAPWVGYAVLSSFVSDRVAGPAAVAIALVGLGVAIRGGNRLAQLLIEISTAVFFTGCTVLVETTGLDAGRWVGAASQLWLAATVAVTLAIHRPFTLAIAQAQAPAEIRDTPEFYRFNVRITTAWLIGFATAGALLAVVAGFDRTRGWLTVAVMVLAIVAPVRYTDRLVGRLRNEQST